jgi:hypothetical protein
MVIEISIHYAEKPIFRRTFDTDGSEPFDRFRLEFYRSFASENPRLSLESPLIGETWCVLDSSESAGTATPEAQHRLGPNSQGRKLASG